MASSQPRKPCAAVTSVGVVRRMAPSGRRERRLVGADSAGECVFEDVREERRAGGVGVEIRVVHRQLEAHAPR